MSISLRHFPEYDLELASFSGNVSADEMLYLYANLGRREKWLFVFSDSADLSNIDIAHLPAMKKAVALDEAEPDGGKPKSAAWVNLSGQNELFFRFWIHYASAGVARPRARATFPTVEGACGWLGLPPTVNDALAAAAAETVADEAAREVGQARAAENRHRIIQCASRLFRECGFEAVTIEEVMKAAGLPRDEFFASFKSKDDLITPALIDAVASFPGPAADLASYAADYLSPTHRADLAGGCVVAALGSETVRQPPEPRAAMTACLNWTIEHLSRSASGSDAAVRRRTAIRAYSAMIGALILARISDDQELAREVLDEVRAWIAEPAGASGALDHGRS